MRLAVTAEIELGADARGRLVAASTAVVIRSDARLDYDHLDRCLRRRARRAPQLVAEPLEIARAAAAALGETRVRQRAGGRLPRAGVRLRRVGRRPSRARGVEQTEAHRLIERLMILANEQVAALLERRRVPALYRVHEQPDPQRVEFMVEQLASLDLPTPPLPERMGPEEAGAPGRRGEPHGRRRGRPARARALGVYIPRAPRPEAGPLQRPQPRATPASPAMPTATSPRRSAATRT